MLTLKKIAKVLQEPGRYFDADGLYLQVPEPGKKAPRSSRASWLLRYQIGGKERWAGLGRLADFTLPEARELARAARQALRKDGVDPIEARNEKRATQAAAARAAQAIPTFREAAERYFRIHSDRWRNAKHRAQFLSTLRDYAFPTMGKLRVNEITTDDVRRVLEPIWKRVPETASRVRGRIESVLSWSIANKYREGPNPARWGDNLEHLLPRPAKAADNHHAAMPYAELPAFVAALRERAGVAARALEFTILTAARTGETIGATWAEIDVDAKTWTVPAARMKAGKEHVVPLSDRALEILASVPREDENDHVFIGPTKGAGLSNMAMASVMRRMGKTDVTTHGFRSSFRDWCGDQTNFPREVAEAALAHAVKGKVEAAYRRATAVEKRRKLMEAWARYVATERPAEGSTVVPLRRGS